MTAGELTNHGIREDDPVARVSGQPFLSARLKMPASVAGLTLYSRSKEFHLASTSPGLPSAQSTTISRASMASVKGIMHGGNDAYPLVVVHVVRVDVLECIGYMCQLRHWRRWDRTGVSVEYAICSGIALRPSTLPRVRATVSAVNTGTLLPPHRIGAPLLCVPAMTQLQCVPLELMPNRSMPCCFAS